MQEQHYGNTRAVNELVSIFSCQWRNGMLPHIRFVPGQHEYRPSADDWAVPANVSGKTLLRTSGITQPPIIGYCVAEVYERIDESARSYYRKDFLHIVEGLEWYHRWLVSERDPWNENLLLCLHPWETGTDNSPAVDPLIDRTHHFIEASDLDVDRFWRADTVHVNQDHRPTERDYYAYFGLLALFKRCRYEQESIIKQSPFLLQDVLFNSLFVASLKSLAKLERALSSFAGDSAESLLRLSEENLARGDRVAHAIRTKLWHEADGFFYPYDCAAGELIRTRTVSGFMPLLGEIASDQQEATLLNRLLAANDFGTMFPVPSTSILESAFDPSRYWSGPTWPVTNWLLFRGLIERKSFLADDLRVRTLRMISGGATLPECLSAAVRTMERNSFGSQYTTPSPWQYQHAWLWDSAIVAAAWPLASAKPNINTVDPLGFWEYYDPNTGAPLGSSQMTWTASVFLDLAVRSGLTGEGQSAKID